MLQPPPHVLDARIVDPRLAYAWDEWRVSRTYQPGDGALATQAAALCHRGNVALCAAMAEWVIWRYQGLVDLQPALDALEAAWAANVHTAYARYFEVEDDDWRGVMLGPQRMALAIVGDLVWGRNQARPGVHAGWLSQLACHVLPTTEAFRAWQSACLQRLLATASAPAPGPAGNPPGSALPDPADAGHAPMFDDEFDIGPWVPRELFDLARPWHPLQTRGLIEQFIAGLDPGRNPQLNQPDEMLAFGDFTGFPYRITDDDT